MIGNAADRLFRGFLGAGCLTIGVLAGCASSEPDAGATSREVAGPAEMTFFLTSVNPGDGADLGGLAGADAYCVSLADAAGAEDQTWRAYLSTRDSDARDRIGSGPWHNANGIMVAANLEVLHGENNLTKETQVNETGAVVNGRGDSPNRHDILTGSRLDGTSFGDDGNDHTCGDWTSSSSDGSAQVGHHDRQGGGADPTSWNSAHGSRGCGLEDLRGTGGDGLFYCFATGR